MDDQPVLEEDVRERTLTVRDIDTSTPAGNPAKVTFVVTSPQANDVVFGVDGSPAP